MSTKLMKKLVEDIYTLTWDYNGMDPSDAKDMACLIDTINYMINKYFKQGRIKIVWCEDEECNLYVKDEETDEYHRYKEVGS